MILVETRIDDGSPRLSVVDEEPGSYLDRLAGFGSLADID